MNGGAQKGAMLDNGDDEDCDIYVKKKNHLFFFPAIICYERMAAALRVHSLYSLF